MAGLVPAIHVFWLQHWFIHSSCPGLSRASTPCPADRKTWMAGTSPAMTRSEVSQPHHCTIVSYKSFHCGLPASIKRTFHVRDQCFMLCSLDRRLNCVVILEIDET